MIYINTADHLKKPSGEFRLYSEFRTIILGIIQSYPDKQIVIESIYHSPGRTIQYCKQLINEMMDRGMVLFCEIRTQSRLDAIEKIIHNHCENQKEPHREQARNILNRIRYETSIECNLHGLKTLCKEKNIACSHIDLTELKEQTHHGGVEHAPTMLHFIGVREDIDSFLNNG